MSAPWNHEIEARELIAAVVDRRYKPTEFRKRFGDDALLDALAGEGTQALAFSLSLEDAVRECIQALSDSPIIAAAEQRRWRCPHENDASYTFNLTQRKSYCSDCEDALTEGWEEMLDVHGGLPDPALPDRCDLCQDLAEVMRIRAPLGDRWVQGGFCKTCSRYGGLG